MPVSCSRKSHGRITPDAPHAAYAKDAGPSPPMCKICAKMCSGPKKEKSSDKSYDLSLDFGALAGTQIPGPLIKSANQALLVHVAACNLLPVFVEIPRIFLKFILHHAANFASVVNHCTG